MPSSPSDEVRAEGPTGAKLPVLSAVKPTSERLTTIDESGRRHWLYPAAFDGRWWRLRQLVNVLLMVVFFGLPWLKVGGHQAVLLDIPARKLSLFGFVLWPQDTFLFWLLLFNFFVAIFLITAQWGRLWCGWACPQTVFMEGVFRRIERLVEGDAMARMRLDGSPWTGRKLGKKLLKHALFLVVSTHVANTAICYFVGTDRVLEMTFRPPSENAGWFGFMLLVNAVVYLDFAWFREQLCTVACPYGRWQSVLLDEHSLIVGYDKERGEPRGRKRDRTAHPETDYGDCVDCTRCVQVCPTGIDIRMGLQMECVNCTACIDACDDIMEKVGKPPGLIRYTSLNELEKKPRKLVRARTVGYGIVLLVAMSAFLYFAAHRKDVEVQVLRGSGRGKSVYTVEGVVYNQLTARIVNKTDQAAEVTVRIEGEGWELDAPRNPFPLEPSSTATMKFLVARKKADSRAGLQVKLVFERQGEVLYDRPVPFLVR